jgi:hypothetical protein
VVRGVITASFASPAAPVTSPISLRLGLDLDQRLDYHQDTRKESPMRATMWAIAVVLLP